MKHKPVDTEFLFHKERDILKSFNITYDNLSICELGSRMCTYSKEKQPMKNIYEKLGVIYTSIDLNGEYGALPLDLCNQLPKEFNNKFNMVTNYGTSEHVLEQYECFKNMHDICKTNGIFFHGIPLINNWKNHCRYYYTIEFFEELILKCNYTKIEVSVLNIKFYTYPKNLVFASFVKSNNNNFISKEEFNSIKGMVDTENNKYTGNYTKK